MVVANEGGLRKLVEPAVEREAGDPLQEEDAAPREAGVLQKEAEQELAQQAAAKHVQVAAHCNMRTRGIRRSQGEEIMRLDPVYQIVEPGF